MGGRLGPSWRQPGRRRNTRRVQLEEMAQALAGIREIWVARRDKRRAELVWHAVAANEPARRLQPTLEA